MDFKTKESCPLFASTIHASPPTGFVSHIYPQSILIGGLKTTITIHVKAR